MIRTMSDETKYDGKYDNEKINIYRCTRGHATVTVDVDEGTTPFMMGCPHKEKDSKHPCCADAQSSFYPQKERAVAALIKYGNPTHEWYKPTEEEVRSRYGDREIHVLAGMLDHVKRGGLDLRERTDKPGVKHK